MVTNAITNPRLDRAFVRSDGVLNEYGYSVLARIIERVGGSVGDVLNGAQIAEAIDLISMSPNPVKPPVPPDFDLLSDIQSMRAELAELQKTVAGLQQGYQV